MSALAYAAIVALSVCLAAIAYVLGYDNGYGRARRDLRETPHRRPPLLLAIARRLPRGPGSGEP